MIGKQRILAEITAEKLWAYKEYAEKITEHAQISLESGTAIPETDAEYALRAAYLDGLKYARTLFLNDLEDQGKELGISICREIADQEKLFVAKDQLSPTRYARRLQEDDGELASLWGRNTELAEVVAFWQGMNDIYEFTICFISRVRYRDDFRNIRRSVERSLGRHGLLDIWLRTSVIAYAEFAPPQERPGEVNGSFFLTRKIL